jgi:glycerophosphoryl diester phosphodiesterase
MMAYLLGSLSILWLLANVTIAFLSNLALTVVIFTTYTRFMGVSDDRLSWEQLTTGTPGGLWNMSAKRFAGLALLISLVAGLTISILIDRLNPEDNTQIIAHRGASADAPENTLAAMELAIHQGADWVEIDVQETAEGEVVVIHDSDLKKVGGSGLRVFQAPLEELQSVDIGSWMDPTFSDQRVPTLQQVLALCKDRINIVIELKYYGLETQLEQSVADIVDTAGMSSQIVVMSLHYAGVQTMKSIRPEWRVGLLSSVAMGDVTRLEVDFLAINANFASRSFIRRAHRQHKKVLVWTVNDPVSMSAMMSKGVDGIITDKPLLASKILRERAELGVHERMMIQLASLMGRKPERPEQ